MSQQTTAQALAILDKAAEEGSALARDVKQSFSACLGLARVANTIRNALSTEVVSEVIMPLKNVDFGWRTDERAGGRQYSIEQIRDCWVSAALAGARPVNNEMNVIAGRCYLTLNFFRRVVGSFPGLTDLREVPGKTLTMPGGATVEMTITYKLNGKDQKVERVGTSAIPVRLNEGMGADGAIGKATRKALKGVYQILTGSQAFADGDVDDNEEVVVSARVIQDSEEKPRASLPSKTATVAAEIAKRTAEDKRVADAITVAKKTPQDKHEEAKPQIAEQAASPAEDDEPWEENEGQASQEAAPTEAATPATAAQTQAAAPATETQPAATAKKKPRGGFVRDEATGEMKRVGANGKAVDPAAATPAPEPTPEKAADPEPAATPKQEEAPFGDEGVQGAPEPKYETTQDIFVGKVTCVRDKDQKALFYKAMTSNSTDVWAVDIADEKLALSIKDEWIPNGKSGAMATIQYSATDIGGHAVNLIKDITQ